MRGSFQAYSYPEVMVSSYQLEHWDKFVNYMYGVAEELFELLSPTPEFLDIGNN